MPATGTIPPKNTYHLTHLEVFLHIGLTRVFCLFTHMALNGNTHILRAMKNLHAEICSYRKDGFDPSPGLIVRHSYDKKTYDIAFCSIFGFAN